MSTGSCSFFFDSTDATFENCPIKSRIWMCLSLLLENHEAGHDLRCVQLDRSMFAGPEGLPRLRPRPRFCHGVQEAEERNKTTRIVGTCLYLSLHLDLYIRLLFFSVLWFSPSPFIRASWNSSFSTLRFPTSYSIPFHRVFHFFSYISNWFSFPPPFRSALPLSFPLFVSSIFSLLAVLRLPLYLR